MHDHHILKYFLSQQFGGGKRGVQKWKTFEHNGVLFPPPYKPHGIPILCNGEKVYLSPEAEEVAMFYAKYYESAYTKNKIFNKNFWNDWKKILGSTHKIQSLDKCDFKKYNEILLTQREEHKASINSSNLTNTDKYKNAVVDGKTQTISNYLIEPPSIFIGRGCNPQLGKLKKRVEPEDITLNMGKEAPIPPAPKGHKWGDIIHDNTLEWVASWKDNVTGKTKYVWLSDHSDFKSESDKSKFELARNLKHKIKKIMEINTENLNSSDLQTQQLATALYFIYKLAIRVGNEKGEDEADTVGVSSLRVEHITLGADDTITLDFLGKDSIRYHNTVKVDRDVYNNVREFTKNKSKDDELFDAINSADINKYLQTFMKGLTSKVFRTYNASELFQKELTKINEKYNKVDINVSILMDEYNKANAKVALLCNHQKNINKSLKQQLEKINDTIKNYKQKLKTAKSASKKKIREQIKKCKSKRELKTQLKNISLGTSKSNYIDPRITVAFMKKHNLPLDKIFSKTLREKFRWAFDVDQSYIF